ncbi:biotin/lipoyl-binding protein [Actinomycetospora endophytica]|uniref:Biotin/lipoyl-binding protein n=1 Tax=Actinomycetospora endophytica TaxID=2291215 RepID=A0ABS8PAY6_9PSEU|nr:biotin/lipoyl-binding protein [Actinomycetospora endophytica]MCD2195378.1 biotin/lipoyl-binding protein [Actinomycetospora endophytica]
MAATLGLVLAGCGSSAPPPPQTVPVARATVSTGVSATGSLSAVGQVNAGFPQAGQLTSVLIGVGDRVQPGQVLATIDDFTARQGVATAQAQLDTAQANLAKLEEGTAVSGAQATLDQARRILHATKDQVGAVADVDDTAVNAAKGPASTAAEQKQQVDQAGGRLQIEMARQGVVTAQNQLDTASANQPHDLDAARAAVAGAQAGVNNANRTLANTTLRAPSAGVVTALNGAVGEFVAANSTPTPVAPGNQAALPGIAPMPATAAAAGATPTQPGGSNFVVLQNPGLFQAVAPFEESDAVSITPAQDASVSVDAIPDRTFSGSVLAVAPSSTAISNVVNYYVTVTLTQNDPRLRDGQTARVSVITGNAPNMLSVPNTAVRHEGDRSSVVVVTADGRRIPTTFTPGLVGADRTEVLAGLTEGQQILVVGGR